MGDSGPTHEVGTFSSHADDLLIEEIVRLHGVPVSIVSDGDPRFTTHFWKSFQKAMGTRLTMSTAFHPQIDGHTERAIQVLEDMLRACVLDHKGSWEEHLPLVEFAYNNSYQVGIPMAPCIVREAMQITVMLDRGGRELHQDLIRDTSEKVSLIRQRLLMAQSRQKSYADVRRRPLKFEVGDHVFLKVMHKRGVVRFGKRRKLSLRFIIPFEILERVGTVAYRLALPLSMSGVHEVFHVSMLWKYTPDPAHVVDWGQIKVDTDGTFEEGPVCILDSRDKVLRRKTVRLVRVLWQHYGVEESTWEHEDTMRATYPFLFRDEGTWFSCLNF